MYTLYAFCYLLFGNHGKYDVSNLSGQSFPFVLILFVTLLQHEDEHLQHLKTRESACKAETRVA